MRWRSSHGPIGVDVGAKTIKVAQLACATGDAWRLHAAVVAPRNGAGPLDAAGWSALLNLFDRAGFRGRNVALHVPPAALRTEMLELPPRSSGAPVDQLSRGELSRAAKLEVAPFEFACWDLPAGARASASTAVMAVALPESDASNVLDPCEAAGLNVTAMDTQAWALVRATTPLRRSDSITAVADLGWENPSVVLIAEGMPVYQRALADASVSLLHRTVMSESDLQAAEANYVLSPGGPLAGEAAKDMPQVGRVRRMVARQAQGIAAEIEASLAYASHRYPRLPVASVLVTGGGAAVPGLVAALGQQLRVTTTAVALGDLIELNGWTGEGATLFATAIGLALHEGGA